MNKILVATAFAAAIPFAAVQAAPTDAGCGLVSMAIYFDPPLANKIDPADALVG